MNSLRRGVPVQGYRFGVLQNATRRAQDNLFAANVTAFLEDLIGRFARNQPERANQSIADAD